MKKKKDIGLEHIINLDISAVRSVREIYNKYVNKYDQEKAKEIMNNIYGQEEMTENTTFLGKKAQTITMIKYYSFATATR